MLFVLGMLGVGSLESTAQQPARKSWVGRQVGRFLRDTLPPNHTRLLVYPTVAYAPETSLEVGLSTLILFYARKDHLRNRLSALNTYGFFTFRKQYGLSLSNTFYGHADRWALLGRMRFQRFPLFYFGIGPETSGESPAKIDATYLQIRERLFGKLRPNLFGGIYVDFQRLSQVRFDPGTNETLTLPTGTRGTSNLGLGASLLFDSRLNPLNACKGWYAELAALKYSPRWGSDFSFQQFLVDVRTYRPLGRGKVLAAHVYSRYAVGGTLPVHHLALMGGEMIQRGYYVGRYRDRAYLAGQVEFRMLPFPFSKRFGGTAFASAGAVAPTLGKLAWKNVQPTGGVGLRYLLFPKKDVFMRLDAGFSREGPGFYLFTGEAF